MVKNNYNNSKFLFVYASHVVICFLLIYGWLFRNKLWLEFLIMASIYIYKQCMGYLMDVYVLDWSANIVNVGKIIVLP